MKRVLSILVLGVLLIALPGMVKAQETKPSLKVGDQAPKLTLESWWKDKELDKLQPGTIYFIDFWASWCPPCRASFPHLKEVRKKYSDQKVEVIAVSIDNSVDSAADFLQSQGGDFPFFIGWDGQQTAWSNWGSAAGQKGIPCTFLVDRDGKIAWIGHPMSSQKPLEDLLKKQPTPAPKQ